MARYIDLGTFTGDATGTAFTWGGDWTHLFALGTWDGATVAIELQHPEGGDWVSVKTLTATTPSGESFLIGRGKLRAAVSSAGASTNLAIHAGRA